MNLLCPSCKSLLDKQLFCSDCDVEYKSSSNPIPVLIDWDKSILNRHDINFDIKDTLVPRSNEKLRQSIKRWLRPNVFKRPIDKNDFLERVNHPKQVLIIGSGTIGYGLNWLYEIEDIEVCGLDIYYSDTVDLIADTHNIPIESNSFDLVIIQAVLEHVLSPIIVVDEIYRVLKPDGFVYAETPFLQAVHEGPYDFTRYTHSGHRFLFKNFLEVDSGVVQGVSTSFIWAASSLAQGLTRNTSFSKVISMLLSPIVFLDMIIPMKYHIIGGNGFYFVGRKAKSDFTVKKVVEYYYGKGEK